MSVLFRALAGGVSGIAALITFANLISSCGSADDPSASSIPSDAQANPESGDGGGGGGDGSGGPYPGLPPETQDALAKDLATAKCDQARMCGGFPIVPKGVHESRFLWYGNPIKATAALCSTETTARFRNSLIAQIDAALKVGAVAFNPDKLAACLDAIRNTCDSDTLLPPACREAFTGTTPAGGKCTNDVVCAGGNLCAFSDDYHCTGKCTVPIKAAEICREGSGCGEGLFCPSGGGLCMLRPGEGETCSDTSPPCKGFLHCLSSSSSAGPQVCKSFAQIATGTLGAGCDLGKGPWCQPPLMCTYETTAFDAGPASGNSCRDTYPSGAACKTGYLDPCPEAEYCETGTGAFSGVCSPRRALGASCTFKQACASGLTCFGGSQNQTGVCSELKANGDKCLGDGQCYSGFCKAGICSVDNPRCAPPK